MVTTTSLSSLVGMHIRPANENGIGVITGIQNTCSLLYDTATELGISHNMVEQRKGVAYSPGDCKQSAYDQIIDDGKADPLLKTVKEGVKALTKKAIPGSKELSQTTHIELKIVAFLTYIQKTWNDIEKIRDSKKLTMSGLFLDTQKLDIMDNWPNNNSVDCDKDIDEREGYMKKALRQF